MTAPRTAAPAPLRFIDLFCGIGGFRIAFEKIGARCVFSSDWDKYSRVTYAANFGESCASSPPFAPSASLPGGSSLRRACGDPIVA